MPIFKPAMAAVPWSAKIVQGSFDGKTYQAGLQIVLKKGWKTYWRNPGESGIPPTISGVGTNLESMEIEFPLPQRLKDESGETIAYHDEVVFLIQAKPANVTQPLQLEFSSFFGVCAEVCTPAKFDGKLNLTPSNALGPDMALISRWQDRVPKKAEFVAIATVHDEFLVLGLRQKLSDIFVEGPDNYYFRAPDFGREKGKAWIKIDGLKKSVNLQGVKLRVTAADGGNGLEQFVVVI